MTAFLLIGMVGVGLIGAALLFGDVLDGMLDFIDLDATGGLFSLPVIGSFIAAFGFGAALLMSGLNFSTGAALGGGVVAGVTMGGAALGVTRALLNMPTDPTPRTQDLVGSLGTVITRIPANGLGEVTIAHAGQRVKLNAKSDVDSGTTVVVVDVTSPTSVVVTESGF